MCSPSTQRAGGRRRGGAGTARAALRRVNKANAKTVLPELLDRGRVLQGVEPSEGGATYPAKAVASVGGRAGGGGPGGATSSLWPATSQAGGGEEGEKLHNSLTRVWLWRNFGDDPVTFTDFNLDLNFNGLIPNYYRASTHDLSFPAL